MPRPQLPLMIRSQPQLPSTNVFHDTWDPTASRGLGAVKAKGESKINAQSLTTAPAKPYIPTNND
eukprot:5198281-Amphidinium_carterae.1